MSLLLAIHVCSYRFDTRIKFFHSYSWGFLVRATWSARVLQSDAHNMSLHLDMSFCTTHPACKHMERVINCMPHLFIGSSLTSFWALSWLLMLSSPDATRRGAGRPKRSLAAPEFSSWLLDTSGPLETCIRTSSQADALLRAADPLAPRLRSRSSNYTRA